MLTTTHHLAHNIRLIRLRRRMTQADLARLAGFTQQYISTLERGLRPRARNIREIARALQVHEDVLTRRPRSLPALPPTSTPVTNAGAAA